MVVDSEWKALIDDYLYPNLPRKQGGGRWKDDFLILHRALRDNPEIAEYYNSRAARYLYETCNNWGLCGYELGLWFDPIQVELDDPRRPFYRNRQLMAALKAKINELGITTGGDIEYCLSMFNVKLYKDVRERFSIIKWVGLIGKRPKWETGRRTRTVPKTKEEILQELS